MVDSPWIDYCRDLDALRLCAGKEFLLELARVFTRMEQSGAEVCELTALPNLKVRGEFRLILDPSIRKDALRAISDDPPTWRLSFSEEGWLEAAEKIAAVAESPGSCHCYLEVIGCNDVIVVVSKGEYVAVDY